MSIVGKSSPRELSTAPEFDRNQTRVHKIEPVSLHPLYHALPKKIEIGRAPTEGAQQIFRRPEPQRFGLAVQTVPRVMVWTPPLFTASIVPKWKCRATT